MNIEELNGKVILLKDGINTAHMDNAVLTITKEIETISNKMSSFSNVKSKGFYITCNSIPSNIAQIPDDESISFKFISNTNDVYKGTVFMPFIRTNGMTLKGIGGLIKEEKKAPESNSEHF